MEFEPCYTNCLAIHNRNMNETCTALRFVFSGIVSTILHYILMKPKKVRFLPLMGLAWYEICKLRSFAQVWAMCRGFRKIGLERRDV